MHLVLFSTTLLFVFTTSAANNDCFRAAVVEYVAKTIFNPFDKVQANLREFNRLAQDAAKNGAQIIVLPEDGLVGYEGLTEFRSRARKGAEFVPRPTADYQPNPCDDQDFNNSTVLRTLSCIAKRHNLFVVADMGGLEKCPGKCENKFNDGYYVYNTAVAFDNTGKFIARYRKHSLFTWLEQKAYDSAPPEMVTFDTPFGGKMGECDHN